MSRYPIEELVKMWATEKITIEQAIGQIILQLQELTRRVLELERANRRSPGVTKEI